MAQLPPNSRGLLVQERVAGFGAGFFALYDRGRLIRTFMHHRIREWPLSGGPSTAARAVRDGAMFDAGKRILDALQWNGPAMVEFKYRSDAGTYTFIEVNGKFWGSVELALSSGVNFAADLVKLHRGDGMSEDHSYDAAREFYWPLDGDILALLGGRRLTGIREYFRPQARTNLGQSITAESLKLGRLVWQLLRRIRGGGG
jgi:predicted ATP-grasp superfamily ATP-dependent carboligase